MLTSFSCFFPKCVVAHNSNLFPFQLFLPSVSGICRSVILSYYILSSIFLIVFPSFSLFLSPFFLLFFPCLSVFYLSRYFFGTQVYSAVETVICIPIRDYERTGPSGFLTSVVIRTIKKYFLIFPYVL